MESIWKNNLNKNKKLFEKPTGDVKTDVLIIGGGMAGLLCAHFLKNKGVDYILAEGQRIGEGISQNTTAKITSQHGLIYQKLIKDSGVEKAKKYLCVNQEALNEFRKLSEKEKIQCDFEEKSAYIYSLTDRNSIEKEVSALARLKFNAKFCEKISLPFELAGAVCFENQAQFNPLKFISEISRDLNIYENTFVRKIEKDTAITDSGKIKADTFIIASHFPFINRYGAYFLKMYQHRSYAVAYKNAPDIGGMYLQETEDGFSFRNYKDYLIIGGGDHKTGKEGGNWKVIRELAAKIYPQSMESEFWAAQDCMTLDGIPYIGRYSKSAQNMYTATGFNKWGMTSSMVSAMIITDLICGKSNEYADIFNPSRSIMKPQLLNNALNAVSNLVSFRTKRCPHMGCALKFNKHENTWDCPCHGSRFDSSGNLTDNPAMKDIKP